METVKKAGYVVIRSRPRWIHIGGGQDRGPTYLGVFVSEAEARACLRREQKRRAADQKSKRRKK